MLKLTLNVLCVKGVIMDLKRYLKSSDGKIGYVIAWLLGVPIPILIIIFLIRGCH